MRGTFVIRLGTETRPSEEHLEGWAEEVDSGKEFRFHSTTELIYFLSDCLRIARQPTNGEQESRGGFDACGAEDL